MRLLATIRFGSNRFRLVGPVGPVRFRSTEPNRTEPNRTEVDRAEQNGAVQNRTEQCSAEQNGTEQNRTAHNRTEQNRTEQNRTEQKTTAPFRCRINLAPNLRSVSCAVPNRIDSLRTPAPKEPRSRTLEQALTLNSNNCERTARIVLRFCLVPPESSRKDFEVAGP